MAVIIFFRRLLRHVAMASLTFFVLSFIVEILFPGAVLSFIDLVDGSLFLFGILLAAIWVEHSL